MILNLLLKPKYNLLCWLILGLSSQLSAQISQFSDEFDDPTTIENWNTHTSGPLSSNYYETLILSDSLISGTTVANAPLGQLTLIPGPTHSGWFDNIMGPMLSRNVTGNFVVTTYITLHNKNDYNGLPTSDYNAAGIIARNPNTEGNENYVITNLGFQSYINGIGTETKVTTDGNSVLHLNPDSSRAEIRLCRVGNVFRTYKRNPTDNSLVLILESVREDLPPTLQVGLMANGWDFEDNAPPDLRAEYDYIRYNMVEDEVGCTLPLIPNDCSEVPFVDAGEDVTICNGRSWELTAIGGTTYNWSTNEMGLNDYTIANPIASPTISTTYFVTITHPNGCTNTDSVAVEVEECTQITCSPLASEGFDYDDLASALWLTDGSGWLTPWLVQNNDTIVPGYHISGNTSMSYRDLNVSGNVLSGGNGGLNIGRRLSNSTTGPFADYLDDFGSIGRDSTTLYVSCLLRKNYGNDQPVYFDLHGNDTGWASISNRVGVGYYGEGSNNGEERYWSLRIENTVYQTTVPIDFAETMFAVLEINFYAGNESVVNLYLNPETLGEDTPPIPTMTQNSSPNFVIRSFMARLGNAVGQGYLDEIRFAESFACAAPDASIELNRPPIANFTADVVEGIAPFNVHFDASASTDDTGIATYDWTFGDGTTGSGISVDHTYEPIGVLQATLTVTDLDGSQHFRTMDIIVQDENGSMPCQTVIRLASPASCGQSDGSLIFYDGMGTDFTLTNSADEIVAPDEVSSIGGIFENLAMGTYTLNVTGANACTDQFVLHIPTDSASCEGWYPNTCSLDIGMNLETIAYWNKERPFKNLFLHSGHFFTYDPTLTGIFSTPYMDEIEVDEAGYPTEVPQTTSGGEQLIRCMISADGSFLLGDYVVLYDGEGTVGIGGSAFVTDAQDGRLEITVYDASTSENPNSSNNTWLNIEVSEASDPIRNIRILRPEHEFEDLVANPFYQTFLDHAANFKALRFMNWQATNHSPLEHWSDRKPPSFHTQETNSFSTPPSRGMAYEYIIQLCNTLQTDAWVCVPHAATDDFITQMAMLFRDNLDPNLTIYLEYSNEVWNWSFAQAHWVADRRPSNLSYPRGIVERARNAFEIWSEVFDGETDRMKRVLGTQVIATQLGEEVLAQMGADGFDYFSPTWYFGLNFDCTNEIWDDTGEVTPQQVLTCVREGWLSWSHIFRQNFWNAKMYGKPVLGYEGGHHITTDGGVYPYQQATYDAHIAPEMYDLYREVMDTLSVFGMEMAMAFTLASERENRFGAWGHLEHIDQDTTTTPAPKYQVLIDQINLCEDRCVPSITLYPPTHNVTNMNRTWTVTDSITTHQHIELTDSARHHRVRYQAGNFVNLLPGFQTTLDNSASVEVVIENCGEQAPVAVSGNKALWEKVEESNIGGEQNLQWQLYPNPAENFAFVEFSLEESESALLEVFDLQGNAVTRLFYNQVEAGVPYRLRLDLGELMQGIYVVQLSTKSGVREVKKLVVF